jgi:hypothetical protein
MKHILLCIAIAQLFFISACKKNGPEPYTYVGTYFGVYTDESNGVDSNGVFKTDTSYTYEVVIEDGGNNAISLNKTLPPIPVDSAGYFSFVEFNRTIEGHFVNDSLYLVSKTLNGSDVFPQWFVIQQLSFVGKK